MDHCFSLSLRDIELILAARGVVVSYETIREWRLRFGRAYAKTLEQRRPQPGDKWFLDEVFVRIRGKLHYHWRGGRPARQRARCAGPASPEHGGRQARRPQAAEGLALRAQSDGSRSTWIPWCRQARDPAGVRIGRCRYLNNRYEVSHQPTRRRERHMRRFKSARQARQFPATHTPIHNHFQLRRHGLSASEYRFALDRAFSSWRDATGTARVG